MLWQGQKIKKLKKKKGKIIESVGPAWDNVCEMSCSFLLGKCLTSRTSPSLNFPWFGGCRLLICFHTMQLMKKWWLPNSSLILCLWTTKPGNLHHWMAPQLVQIFMELQLLGQLPTLIDYLDHGDPILITTWIFNAVHTMNLYFM